MLTLLAMIGLFLLVLGLVIVLLMGVLQQRHGRHVRERVQLCDFHWDR